MQNTAENNSSTEAPSDLSRRGARLAGILDPQRRRTGGDNPMMKEMKNVRIRCDPEEGLVWIEEDVDERVEKVELTLEQAQIVADWLEELRWIGEDDEREAAQSGGEMP